MTITHTATIRPATSTTAGRLRSLGAAEARQFLRNKVLLFMMSFPVLVAVGLYLMLAHAGTREVAVASATESLSIMTLTFIVYYSVLSMATTRRDEKVLKRLRTGEATDREILTAFAVPGVLLTLLSCIISVAILLIAGAPLPVNPLPVLVALLLGCVIAAGLALLTSTITQNAEVAQMTSMPVILLAVFSQAGIRTALPESVQRIFDLTPFALISDLVQLGWTGATVPQLQTGTTPLGAAEVLAGTWQPMLILAAWAVAVTWAGVRYMKWDSHR